MARGGLTRYAQLIMAFVGGFLTCATFFAHFDHADSEVVPVQHSSMQSLRGGTSIGARSHAAEAPTLLVSGLPRDIQEAELQMVFGTYGTVAKIAMMASDGADDLRTASVTYAKSSTGEIAVKLLNDVYKIREDAARPIHVEWAVKPKETPPLLSNDAANGQVPTWQYWDWCSGASRCQPLSPYGGAALPGDEKFLMADVRGAGWNNNRQSLELAYALAFVWRRTLVLPAWFGNPCDPSDLHDVNVSFDVQAMSAGINVITASDFVAYAKANPNRFPGGAAAVERFRIHPQDYWKDTRNRGRDCWRDMKGWFDGTHGVAETLWEGIPEVPPYVIIGAAMAPVELMKLRASGHFQRFSTPHRSGKVLALSEKEAQATALYIGPRKLLGNFYSLIYVPNPMIGWQLRSTIRRALHLRPEYFAAAEAAMQVAGLRPGEYSAMHNRQGDFERVYKIFYLDPKNPARFLSSPQNQNFVAQYGKMYMATKTWPGQAGPLRDIFIPALRKQMPEPKNIISLAADVDAAARARVGHLPGWQGLVEMIICAQAGIFLASWGSTFSGYIHRLRGYMPLIADKRMLYTDGNMSDRRSSPLWSVGSNVNQISWIREWPEGFQI